jgi:hypothetical protein
MGWAAAAACRAMLNLLRGRPGSGRRRARRTARAGAVHDVRPGGPRTSRAGRGTPFSRAMRVRGFPRADVAAVMIAALESGRAARRSSDQRCRAKRDAWGSARFAGLPASPDGRPHSTSAYFKASGHRDREVRNSCLSATHLGNDDPIACVTEIHGAGAHVARRAAGEYHRVHPCQLSTEPTGVSWNTLAIRLLKMALGRWTPGIELGALGASLMFCSESSVLRCPRLRRPRRQAGTPCRSRSRPAAAAGELQRDGSRSPVAWDLSRRPEAPTSYRRTAGRC